jgi:hypothetical protein
MASILVPLVALLIAALVVAALWLWWTGDQSDAADADGSDDLSANSIMTLDITPTIADATAPIAASPVMGTTAGGIEILRVARDRNGALNVMLGGVTYRNMSEFEGNPLMRDDFLSTVQALAQFAQSTDNVAAPAIGAPTPIIPATEPAPVRVEAPKPASSPKAGSSPKTAEEEAAALEAERNSMAGQIETLLQARLLRTSEMDGRSIHIHSAPSGGVEINIDGTLYDSVSDITDTAARSVIEAAIRDWEAANPI